MTVGEDGATHYGTSVETIAARADRMGRRRGRPQLLGGTGHRCSRRSSAWRSCSTRPLSAQPNAGLPRSVGDRRIYLASPEYMAQYARRLITGGSVVHRGMLRDHARSHPADQGVRRRVAAEASLGRGSGRTAVRAGGSPPVPLPAAIRVGSQARERDVRTQRRAGASPGLGSRRRCCERCRVLQRSRGGRGQPGGRRPRAEPHGSGPRRPPRRAGDRPGDRLPLHLSRPEHARHAQRSAGRGRRGSPKRAHRDRRSARPLGPTPMPRPSSTSTASA